MPRSALTRGFCCILGAVACLYLPRDALAGRFCRILGAFQELFSWLQKATLGTSLPPNASRRPCERLLLHSGGSSLASTASRRLRRRLLRHSGRFPRAFLVASEASLLQMPRGALAKGFCCILGAVAWLQLPRGAFAGGFCSILGAFQELIF